MFNKFLIIFLIILFALPLTLLADDATITEKGIKGSLTEFAKEADATLAEEGTTGATIGFTQKKTEGAPTKVFEKFTGFNQNFIGFLQWLFPIMLSVSAILAVLMLIFAGFKWMAGAISPPEVDAAKKMIAAAVSGLALALGSWLILNTINPNLIKLEKPKGSVPTTFQPPSEITLNSPICINTEHSSIVESNINLILKNNECEKLGGKLKPIGSEFYSEGKWVQCPKDKTGFICEKASEASELKYKKVD